MGNLSKTKWANLKAFAFQQSPKEMTRHNTPRHWLLVMLHEYNTLTWTRKDDKNNKFLNIHRTWVFDTRVWYMSDMAQLHDWRIYAICLAIFGICGAW